MCANPACAAQGIPSHNQQQGEYCTLSCRQACLGKGKGKGPGKGGGYPVGKGGGALPLPPLTAGAAAVPICARPGCSQRTYNGQPGQFCSHWCRKSGGSAPSSSAPIQAAGQSSAQSSCTQLSLPNKDLQDVWKQFSDKWDPQRGGLPSFSAVFKIRVAKPIYDAYRAKVNSIGHGCGSYGQGRMPGNVHRRFHGSYFTCQFAGQVCSNAGLGCPGCGIIRNGFLISHLGQNTGNTGLFGSGHYSTAMSATAHSYAISGNKRPQNFRPVVLVCAVAVGRAHRIQVAAGGQHLAPLPAGCHSRVIDKGSGVDELVVPDDDQMLPSFAIIF